MLNFIEFVWIEIVVVNLELLGDINGYFTNFDSSFEKKKHGKYTRKNSHHKK